MATARTDLERFRDLVEHDEALEGELAEITDPGVFVARVVALARARGLAVERDEVAAAVDGDPRPRRARSVT